ncbi:MAG TPA: hypothetical protein PKB13_03545 [Clostridia bacterium]|nr:hypothetical protein [Clostridia bacterium]
MFFIENALGALLRRRPNRVLSYGTDLNYGAFAAANTPGLAELDAQKNAAFGFSPRFYVALDEKGKNSQWLSRTVSSLEAQSYKNFSFGERPWMASFDYLLYISEGDVLAPDALYCFARAIEQNPEADLLYADEDVMGESGERHAPHFKADFNEFTLLSYNCIGRPLVASRAVFELCGEQLSSSAGDEYEYALRCVSRSETILHLPRVLYARRVHAGDIGSAKGRAAIDAYLAQKRLHGCAADGLYENSFRTAVVPRKSPRVSIVVTADGELSPLRRLLESIEENTIYDDYRIVVAARKKSEPRFETYLSLLQKNGAAKVVNCEGLNYAKACEAAARAASCDALVFLNMRAQIVSPVWLDALLEQLYRFGVGAVGGKLVDENGRIAHAGLVLGLCGLAQSPFYGSEDNTDDLLKNRFINAIRGVSALSGSLLAVTREVFFNTGGFDEGYGSEHMPVLFCQKLVRNGLSCVYTPFCQVRVCAGWNDASDETPTSRFMAFAALKDAIRKEDPYYSKNYSRTNVLPSVRIPEE